MKKYSFLSILVLSSVLALTACSSSAEHQQQSSSSVESQSSELNDSKAETLFTSQVLVRENVTEDVWPSYPEAFHIVWSNDIEGLSKYPAFSTMAATQQERMYVFIDEIKKQVNFGKVVLKENRIIVNYTTGTPKIPRVVGHQQFFNVNALEVDTHLLDSGIYQVAFVDQDGKITLTKEINFTQPYYGYQWKTTHLNWANPNQLIFASTKETGNWAVWSLDISEEGNEPVQLTTRHEDMPLNQLPTLGSLDINAPYPVYNSNYGKIVYHSEHDLWSVTPKGTQDYALTIQSDENPVQEGLYSFDNEPKLSSDGKYILFRKVYDPEKSELWMMSVDGKVKKKIPLPQLGYLEYFNWSPKNDQIVVSISTQEGELHNGESHVWVLYPEEYNPRKGTEKATAPKECRDAVERENMDKCMKDKKIAELQELNPIQKDKQVESVADYKKRLQPRLISTGGYSVKDISFSSDNKSLVFSLRLNATTDDVLTDIWTTNSNNTELTRLTPKDSQKDVSPVWSPNGTKIAFLSSNNKNDYYIWTMDKNGENRKMINDTIAVSDIPLWSPDGKYLYAPTSKGGIYQFDVETGEAVEVLNEGA